MQAFIEKLKTYLRWPYQEYSKLPYHDRKKLKMRVSNVIMYTFLFICLFPIIWMFFSSFKSNSEILEGKVPISRAKKDVIFSKIENGFFWVITSDGTVSQYEKDNLRLLKRKKFKTYSTNAISSDRYLWLASSNRGLIRIDKTNMGKVSRYQIPFGEYLDQNKISKTLLALDEAHGQLWVSVGYQNYLKVLLFNIPQKSFEKTVDIKDWLPKGKTALSGIHYQNGNLIIASNAGLLQLDAVTLQKKNYLTLPEFSSNEPRLFAFDDAQRVYISSIYNIFTYDLVNKTLTKIYSTLSQQPPAQVSSLTAFDDKLFVGTSFGFLIGNGAQFKNIQQPLFDDVDEKGYLVKPAKLVVSDVLALAEGAEDQIILGGSSGRVTLFNIKTETPLKTLLLDFKPFVQVRYRNYVDLWHNINFGQYLKNSFIICGATMIIAMILATFTAYGLVRFDFPGRKLVSMAILTTQMIPGVMFLIPIFLMFVKFSLMTGIATKGTYWGVIFVYATFFLPFSVWILRGFFAAIPISLEEAARIDGCNAFQVFWKIAFPLSVPGIIATGIFVFLVAWDELIFAWVLTNHDTATIPVGIRLFVGNFQNRYDLLMAASTVATLPVMILFFLLQKHIVSGLTAGAVKG